MKKKFMFIVVSVVLLLTLTVNAMAIKVGTTEWDKPVGCQTTKKAVIGAASGTQVKTLRNVTSEAFFDGTHPLHISYSQSGSGTFGINGGVTAEIKGVVSISSGISYSWTAGEAASHTWDINKGDKVGYYNIRYNLKFNKHSYKYYTRTSTIFSTGAWTQKSSGTALDKGSNSPYFMLGYHN